MNEVAEKKLKGPDRRIRNIVIQIGRIQTAKANSPRFAKFIIKTSSGSREVRKAVINEIIDLAYIERVQITVDKILVEKRGNSMILQKINQI